MIVHKEPTIYFSYTDGPDAVSEARKYCEKMEFTVDQVRLRRVDNSVEVVEIVGN